MKKIKLLSISAILLLLIACSDDDNSIVDVNTDLKISIQDNYANLVYANYLDAYNAAIDLQGAVEDFVADPSSADQFSVTKTSWLEARESYGQTEAFRFASGPIDDEDGPEGQLNAWPLDEAYVDYVDGDSDAGIINNVDTYPTITAEVLISLNEQGGETNISVGYHAIEFLLWGQDLTTPFEKLAGQRPHTDFVDDGTASNQSRRRDYLTACAQILVDDLKSMVDEWDINLTGNYREEFLSLPPETALKNMLTSIGVLGKSELAGERIFTAYDNKDQEDEHSCFSDNTHRDIRLNAYGIRNVYTGKYGNINGASIHDLITIIDSDLATEVLDQLNAAVAAVDATDNPFDFAISDETTRPQVLTAVNELRTLGDNFAAVGTAFGLAINTDLPE